MSFCVDGSRSPNSHSALGGCRIGECPLRPIQKGSAMNMEFS